MRTSWLAGLAIAFSGFLSSPAIADTSDRCEGNQACQIKDRSYHVRAPKGWDGKTPLPVLLYFHGWGRTGLNPINNPKVGGATDSNNVLLVAPNGIRRSWDFWDYDSRDTPFVDKVLADVSARWPIDRKRIFISGYSYGAAMAWRLACERGSEFAGYLSIAGTLWRQNDIQCAGGPVNLAHVHGLRDNVMDLPTGTDGDPLNGIALWRRINQCEGRPDQIEETGTFTCYAWSSCGSGKRTSACFHKSGHLIPKGWLNATLKQVLREPAS
ncbi:alpha/beta hydrolase family esterase [Coralliovum pocilloporae]|uniref:alpha/beta hydrolase family esterase n=1 Tax=Coralliovum pocilloporae TaxID=3066369 RepID=UPI003307A04E